MFLHYLILHKN